VYREEKPTFAKAEDLESLRLDFKSLPTLDKVMDELKVVKN
jgi:hypothetical protein